jgi:hypothetical protein
MTKWLKRADLYEKVWSTPVIRLATEFGLSDVALHKICRRHKIPVPPRGYWAKLAAGKKVAKLPLPKIDQPRLENIQMPHRSAAAYSDRVLKAKREGKALEHATKPGPSAPCSKPDLSPLIESTRQALESAKPKKDGFLRLEAKKKFAVCVSPALKDRAYLALERLVTTASARGYAFEATDAGLGMKIGEDVIGLAIIETIKKVPHEPSEAEAARLARWERDAQRLRAKGRWVSEWDKPKIPEFDEVPSGQLTVELDSGPHYDRLRRRFSDGKRQRVEDLAEKLVTAAAACAAAAVDRREEAIRRKKESEEWERRRRENERIQTLYNKRIEFIKLVSQRMADAKFFEDFVWNYERLAAGADLTGSVKTLLAWASGEAEAIRAQIRPDRLTEELDAQQLINDAACISSWTKFNL